MPLPSILVLLLLAAAGEACSVPVFAYALRRWVPDVHTLATARDEAWRQALTQQADAAAANLAVEAGEGADRLSHDSRYGCWWTGAMDDRRRAALLVSPLRRELVRRLAAGESAVWLFIPGGDAAADRAARALLSDRLTYLARVTELPKVDDEEHSADEVMRSAGPPVRLAFSILDLRRDDAAEWVLAAQAAAMVRSATGPCAIPVYGRARALAVLAGERFASEAIDAVAAFLTGACSCQVKEQNPGWDLLVACDWREELSAAAIAAAAATAATAAPPAVPETVVIRPQAPIPAASATAAAPSPARGAWRWMLALAVAAYLGLLIGTRILRRRRSA